jgi:hypothetical protein
MGQFQAAYDIDKETLARRRRIFGEDSRSTLFSAHVLADDLRGLGDYEAARALDRDTLDRCRRVLGEDHPDTLTYARNLADDLRRLGQAPDNSDT